MRKLSSVLIFLSLSLALFSHPWKPGHYVIIDTDGGIDDIKAVSMLLASPDVRVLAITVSPGVLDVSEAYRKIRSLLNSYYHEGIPVGVYRGGKYDSPDFKPAMNTVWGDEKGIDYANAPDADSVIKDMLIHESTRISYICLGSLATVHDAMNNLPVFGRQVKEIIWSSPGPDKKDGFNYNIDKKSALKVLKGNIPVKMVEGTGDEIFYNKSLLDQLGKVPTVYAGKISAYLLSAEATAHEYAREGKDEMT
ncbi:MAG TPA: nucleoside hydrolase, partial [Bacteroidales bacterium]|nr:nucleoside hydrolase [Bacteroidales bacterium]